MNDNDIACLEYAQHQYSNRNMADNEMEEWADSHKQAVADWRERKMKCVDEIDAWCQRWGWDWGDELYPKDPSVFFYTKERNKQ